LRKVFENVGGGGRPKKIGLTGGITFSRGPSKKEIMEKEKNGLWGGGWGGAVPEKWPGEFHEGLTPEENAKKKKESAWEGAPAWGNGASKKVVNGGGRRKNQ